MKFANPCSNFNHGRMNAPVKFCPMCGEVVNRVASARCDSQTHAQRRKDRYAFCPDCGTKLAAGPRI